jgi:hypothetical protein
MREQVEGKLFPELADVVAPGRCMPKEPNDARTKARNNDARTKARNAAEHRALAYRISWIASAALFAIGGIVALWAVGVPPLFR